VRLDLLAADRDPEFFLTDSTTVEGVSKQASDWTMKALTSPLRIAIAYLPVMIGQ